MSNTLARLPRKLSTLGLTSLPAVFIVPGEKAAKRFLEFFTANIRNSNTREASIGQSVISATGASNKT